MSGTHNQRANTWHPWKGAVGETKVTRQQTRAKLRQIAYREISAQYPGESHHMRRLLALAKAKREYRTTKGLPV